VASQMIGRFPATGVGLAKGSKEKGLIGEAG